MLWKCCTQYASKLGKSNSAHRTGIPIPKKANAKECSNYCTIALISHSRKVMLKILQARLQHMNWELPDVQDGFRKGRGNRNQIASFCWIIEKARELKKKNTSALLTTPKPLCRSQQTVENSLRDGNTRSLYQHLEISVCRSRSNS